jgi:uncharacterized protein
MLQIGKMNTLKIKEIRAAGVYLDTGGISDIFISKKSVPASSQLGDTLEVFVSVDKNNALQGTLQKPLAIVGEYAMLRVVSDSPAGAFLYWGMENDLLVPKAEQQQKMVQGQSYVVFIFLSEKTNRIVASSKLDKFLSTESPDYKEGEEVDLLLFEKTDLGYRALVNRAHAGMIYTNEVFQQLRIGQRVKGYINKIRDDQKIDLILQQPGYQGVDGVSQNILAIIQEHGGKVPVTDKSPPDEIYALFSVSKKVFKKAIGALYKKRIIRIEADGISLT